MGQHFSCFKAYDIRGRVPDELNPALAYKIGRAFAEQTLAREIVVGRDIRQSSKEISGSLTKGLQDAGVDVLDIGLCGTEEVYFATYSSNAGGGIMVTASHNPPEYNGMKFVREGARPVSRDSGLLELEERIAAPEFKPAARSGKYRLYGHRDEYVRYLLRQVDLRALKPLRIVVNAGNGCAGPLVDALEPHLPFTFIKLQHQPDGTFPNGVPNPLLPENRAVTAKAVVQHGADLGIAWDGDFDRCFLFDEHGEFIEGYYIVGLIAQALLARYPGEKIVHDPRLVWNTVDAVREAGGVPVMCKAGHAFIKERMRTENAVYGGEMSGHHYFREFAYCDNGTLPWLLVAQLISTKGRLSELVAEPIARYPASGEINLELADSANALERLKARYAPSALSISEIDGLSLEFKDWRFNVRPSNTEPVIRINVEARGDRKLLSQKTQEVLEFLRGNN